MRIHLTILILFCLTTAYCQGITSASVTFVKKTMVDKKAYEDTELHNKIPDSYDEEMTLIFNENESIYLDLTGKPLSEWKQISAANGEGKIYASIKRPKNITYRNSQSGVLLEEKTFLGKKFLISGKSVPVKWKMTGRQKAVAEQMCMSAETTIDTQLIRIWFAPGIPVSNGPEIFGDLPGVVLQVQWTKAGHEITAQRVDTDNVPLHEIRPPQKGKNISREKFQEIFAQKTSKRKSKYADVNVRYFQY